jgi:hypothetical protein
LGWHVVIAIARAVVDEHAFGAFTKIGYRAIASLNITGAIAVFRLSRKAIAFSAHSAQVNAIASSSYFEEASLRLGFSKLNQPTFMRIIADC